LKLVGEATRPVLATAGDVQDSNVAMDGSVARTRRFMKRRWWSGIEVQLQAIGGLHSPTRLNQVGSTVAQ
jgi:hypothetical protein